MRRSFTDRAYIGIELEINQKIVFEDGRRWTSLRSALIDSLRRVCADSARYDQGPPTR
jgi:hypothetical protein